ncbi:hypothetical protein [Candidatus Accumulibacter aalborgensis]|uniref:hypothetical protein n=1 Tax=Candidatus Accumulibacter aalborgensis TaxID=1860102 RepID=UPI001646CA87|nr:hypothetical protein [Candidatus Accumulibacter aalborgensis]
MTSPALATGASTGSKLPPSAKRWFDPAPLLRLHSQRHSPRLVERNLLFPHGAQSARADLVAPVGEFRRTLVAVHGAGEELSALGRSRAGRQCALNLAKHADADPSVWPTIRVD